MAPFMVPSSRSIRVSALVSMPEMPTRPCLCKNSVSIALDCQWLGVKDTSLTTKPRGNGRLSSVAALIP